MADPKHDRPVQLDTDEARAGATPGMTRYILGASLLLIVVAFLAVYFLR